MPTGTAPAAAAAGAAEAPSTNPAGKAGAAAAGMRVGPWVKKKRLGMAGLSGGGSGGSSGGSRRLSPAEALAQELKSADDCDMF